LAPEALREEQEKETMSDHEARPDRHDQSPAALLLRMVTGYWVSQALYVVAKLGIADLLRDGAQESAALARATGMHTHALYRMLRTLASVGVFVEDEAGRFRLTPIGACLQTGSPGSLRAWTMAAGEELYRAWGDILYSVQTGKTAFEHVFGMRTYDYRAHHPAAAAVFNTAMTEWTTLATQAIVAAYDFSSFARVVDVGGGHGQFLTALLHAYPRLQGVLYELPYVAAGAQQQVAAAGLADRCEVIGGDVFTGVPHGGDGYILKNVLEGFDDAQTVTVLTHCHQAMPAHGKLLVMGWVILPGNAPAFSKLLDLHTLVAVGGLVRTEAEYRQLFAAAGFRLTQISPTQSVIGESIVEGAPM
jgi:hypothetical protein